MLLMMGSLAMGFLAPSRELLEGWGARGIRPGQQEHGACCCPASTGAGSQVQSGRDVSRPT